MPFSIMSTIMFVGQSALIIASDAANGPLVLIIFVSSTRRKIRYININVLHKPASMMLLLLHVLLHLHRGKNPIQI